MKKIIVAVVLPLIAACSNNKAADIISLEKKSASQFSKIGKPAAVGCMSVVEAEAKKRNNPAILIYGLEFCVDIARAVVDQTLNREGCSTSDQECHFLSGCVKTDIAVNGLPKDKKEEAALAKRCSDALVLSKDEDEKNQVVKRGQ